jgi:hypothetical protein
LVIIAMKGLMYEPLTDAQIGQRVCRGAPEAESHAWLVETIA